MCCRGWVLKDGAYEGRVCFSLCIPMAGSRSFLQQVQNAICPAVTLMWLHHFSLVLVTSRHVYPFKGVTVNAVYTYRKEASSSVRCRSLNTFLVFSGSYHIWHICRAWWHPPGGWHSLNWMRFSGRLCSRMQIVSHKIIRKTLLLWCLLCFYIHWTALA